MYKNTHEFTVESVGRSHDFQTYGGGAEWVRLIAMNGFDEISIVVPNENIPEIGARIKVVIEW